MSMVVEDGTGTNAAANSYASLDYANSYFKDRGNVIWSELAGSVRTAYLIQATDYIGLRFQGRFRGEILLEGQPLDFPRQCNGYPPMPNNLVRATCEYAALCVNGPLAPSTIYDDTGRIITKKVEKVGPIDEETSYATRGAMSVPVTFRPYTVPDGLMKALVRTQNKGVMRG